jgi:hypothetical protein
MKKLLIILSIVSLYACKKCAMCTYNVRYRSVEVSKPNGEITKDSIGDVSQTYYEDICGSAEIKNAEVKKEEKLQTIDLGSFILTTYKITECNCTVK